MKHLLPVFIMALTLTTTKTVSAVTDWTQNAYLIERGTELHKYIDDVTLEIFDSPLKKTLCEVYQNPRSAYHSLGVSAETAVALFKGCTPKEAPLTKTLPKKYYLSFTSESRLDSWTDYGNRTYIFVNGSLTRDHLKSVILHEIAMSTDAKTNMLYSSYLNYRSQERSMISGNTKIITMDKLSPYEDSLRRAFNYASWGPLSRAFATLRAFNMELLSQNQEIDIRDPNFCSSLVRETFYRVQYLPEPPKSSAIDSISEMLAQASDKRLAPKTPEEELQVLNFLLSKDLILKDLDNKNVTFCQFMLRPLLTGKSLYSHLSAGPRPRLTGGSGGQGRDSQQSTSLEKLIQQASGKKGLHIDDRRLQQAMERLKEVSTTTKESESR